jgi:hypothetical protein
VGFFIFTVDKKETRLKIGPRGGGQKRRMSVWGAGPIKIDQTIIVCCPSQSKNFYHYFFISDVEL